jgi:hypothetical protein
MYGFSPERWEYIWKNADYWEVLKPSGDSLVRLQKRKLFFENKGFEVIPYVDRGVSVGLYVMKKDGKRTYGEDAVCAERPSDAL